MKTSKLSVALLLASFATIVGCKDPDKNSDPAPVITDDLYKAGVFIINEGNFGSGNASIDFFNRDSNKVIKNVFQTINQRPLGDVAQSMTIHNDKGYIVLNVSGKVEVIDAKTFQSTGTISGLTSPRYFTAVSDNKAYVSDWTANVVRVVNLQTLAISKSITVGGGPETMVKVGNKVYVTNSGGYGLDSTVTVINTTTDEVETTIKVGDAPVGIVADANGKVWVLCRGDYGDFMDPNDDTKGKIVRINPANNTVEQSFEFGEVGDHPDRLSIGKDKNMLYFVSSYGFGAGIFKLSITDQAAPSAPFINGYFYGLGVDPVDGKIYASDPVDFNQNGYMIRYNPANGSPVDTFSVGIIPNGISFNQ